MVTQLLSDRLELRDLKAALEAAASNGHLTVVNLLIDYEHRLGLAGVETVKSPTLVGQPLYSAVRWADSGLGDL